MSTSVRWRKSSRSNVSSQSDCVELGVLSSNEVGVRDSKNVTAGHLTFSKQTLASFVKDVKRGAYGI